VKQSGLASTTQQASSANDGKPCFIAVDMGAEQVVRAEARKVGGLLSLFWQESTTIVSTDTFEHPEHCHLQCIGAEQPGHLG
jgi:hypothetical protein